MNRALLTLLVSLWKLILFLPRPLHKVFIIILGNLIYLMPIKRNKISKKNIDLCFPNMPSKQRKNLLKANIVSSAQIVFDSGIAWFWSDKKINKHINYEINGIESLLHEQKNNNGVLLFFKHSLHLELDSRILAINAEIYGVERKHNSTYFESIQKNGRLKSMKGVADRNSTISFIRWLKNGKTVLYAPDQDYGIKKSDVMILYLSKIFKLFLY